MKTRELLVCDMRALAAKAAHLKPKELYRHMERIAASLGEPNCEALLRTAIDNLFVDGSIPETGQDEMDRVYDAIGKHIVITEDNSETVMRLLALCVFFLRQRVKEAARERRIAERRAAPHHGDRCQDPDCAQHGHRHSAPGEPTPAASLSDD